MRNLDSRFALSFLLAVALSAASAPAHSATPPDVPNLYLMAREFYVQGEYDLCIKTLDQMKTEYEKSRDLRTFCEQGAELVMRQKALDAKHPRTPAAKN